MTKMKKILLLGGSAQQVVAIKAAKRLGYYTVLCDYLPDNPGQYEADKYYNVSTTDIEEVYKIAVKEQVDGILPYASDPAALPAAVVAERLGLPTNPVKAVEILGVKHNFRRFLEDNGFACPRNIVIDVCQELEKTKAQASALSFPIVVKPTDSSGSKGVNVLHDINLLEEAVKQAASYSRNRILILEEYIESSFPAVVGGDIFVWNGKIVLFGEMACLRGNKGKGLVPIGEKNPGGMDNKQIENIHDELSRLISALGIKFGELNIELLLDKNDNVHFLEVGPRAGGNMIPIQLSDIFGVNLVEANVLAAMGENPKINPKRKEGCYLTYVLHSYADGRFNCVSIEEPYAQKVYRKVIYKNVGDIVEAFDGAGKALGILFFRFDTQDEMEKFCERAEEIVIVNLA